MKAKKSIKNDYSVLLSKGKWYNPNSFNAIDSAIVYLIALIVMFILDFVVPPALRFVYNMFLDDYYELLLISLLISQGSIFLIAFFASKFKRVGILTGSGYRFKFDFVKIIMGIMMTFGVYFVFYSLHMDFIDDISVVAFGNNSIIDNLDGLYGKNIFALIIAELVLIPILPCIAEEALFRGVIMRGLEEYGSATAIVLSGIMFALMHGNYQQIILQFIAGMAFAFCVITTKNFMVGAAMHFANNLFVVAFSAFVAIADDIYFRFGHYIDAIGIIMGLIMLITSCIYFGRIAINDYRKRITHEKIEVDENSPKSVFTDYENVNNNCVTVSMEEVDAFVKDAPVGTMFLYGNRFCVLNKKSKKKTVVVIITIGILFALSVILFDILGF